MSIKKFFKENFGVIIRVMAVLLLIFAIAFPVSQNINKNNNNNCISAYAVEEISTSLPFDVVRTGVSSIYVYPTYDYLNDLWTNDTRSFQMPCYFYVNYTDGYYYFSFDYNNIVGNLMVINCDRNYYLTANVISSNLFALNTLFNYQSSTSRYYCKLNDIPYANFALVYVQSSKITPLVFVENIQSGLQELTNNVIYNTMDMRTIYAFNTTSVENIIQYNYFDIVSYSPYNSYIPSINGFRNNMPTRSQREFVLTAEYQYEEGYNNGYSAGYQVGYEDAVEMNRFNPFDDTFVMGASVMAFQHGGEIQSNLGASGYDYTQYGIKNTQSMKDWLNSQTLEEYAPYITYYRIGVSLTNSSHSGVELNDESELYIGFYNSDDEFTTILTENLDVNMVLKNANTNSSTSLSFTLYSGSNAVIDFSNINGVDYSGYYFRDIDIRKTNIFAHEIYEFRFSEVLGTYQQGYKNGYTAGISKSNYQNGYNQGYADASSNNGYTFFSLIGAVIDAPITYFTSLFDYEILGTNIKGFLLALLTIGIALAVIRISLAKK